jgi:hypothetical protein|tara:strand:+ start:225 stop:782 length:558 start_codon:yes stop_codon:yes gene_type:complete
MSTTSETPQSNKHKWFWWLLRLLLGCLPIVGWVWAFTQALRFLSDSCDTENDEYSPCDSIPCGRWTRFGAGVIDILLAWILFLIPVFGWIVGIWFIIVRDGLRKPGASPGKRLFRLKVISWNKPYLPEKAVMRNILVIVPLLNIIGILIEGVVLLLTKDPSRLIGDRIAGIKVVCASKTSISNGD